MTATATMRRWWSAYECNPTQMVKVPFPGSGRAWLLPVARESKPVWLAVCQIMESEPYLFLDSAGGTYKCRKIGDSGNMSLHSFGIALDLNPKKNPHKSPLTTDMPPSFIARMEGIRANGKKAIMWGGRWSKPDAMHYQLDVAPADCKNVTWDKGGAPPPNNGDDDDMPLTDEEIEKIAKRTAQLVWAEQVSVPDQGTKSQGWVSGQTYVSANRAVKAAEEAAANTKPK